MKRWLYGVAALLAALVAIGLPIVISVWLAHQRSMDTEVLHASTVADEILKRTDQMTAEVSAAYDRLEAEAPSEPCSPEGVELLRAVTVSSPRLQVVGLLRGDRLVCSSLGLHPEGLPLGAPEWTNSRGVAIRPSIAFQPGSARYLVLQKGRWAIAVDTARVLDMFTGEHLSIGIFDPGSGRLIGRQGVFDAGWPKKLGTNSRKVLFDRRYLVVMRRSGAFQVAVYAALPVEYLRGRIYGQVMLFLPGGIVVGTLLAFALFRLQQRRTSFRARLRTAIARRELEVEYQPVVDLRDGRIVGAEALLRWPNRPTPSDGPDRIVRAASEFGLIRNVTDSVMERVAADVPRIAELLPKAYVSINLSAEDLHDSSIVERLRGLTSAGSVTEAHFLVEATEHSFVDPKLAKSSIEALRAKGFRVAIDDFGTGFSSLSQLAKIPLDFLKIDRSFVETIGTDSATSQVAQHILEIARSLGLEVIAEGVEREEQVAFLRDRGVRFAQGWFYHRAMKIGSLLELLAAQQDQARQVAAP